MDTNLYNKIYKYLATAFWSAENNTKTGKDIRMMMDKEFGEETMRQFAIKLDEERSDF